MSREAQVRICERLGAKLPGLLGGNAGEQPDQGIAGRNSSADDEKERDPPGGFFSLGAGPTAGGGRFPFQGLLLGLNAFAAPFILYD